MEILIDGKWTDNDETYPFGAGRSVRLAFEFLYHTADGSTPFPFEEDTIIFMFPRLEFYLINFVVLASERYKTRGLFLSRPKTLCRYLATSPPQL